MSESEKPAKKPGKMKKVLLLTVLVLGIGGGGVGAGLYASGMLGGKGGHDEPEIDEHLPKLVLKDGTTEAEAAKYASAKGDSSPDPRKFKASYYPLKDNFTVNLKDTEGFIQIGLGVSTFYDEQVLKNIELHEMAIRSAILMTLSNQDPFALATPEGKDALRKQLRVAINDVLKQKEGFGGIDDVYFTSLVIQ